MSKATQGPRLEELSETTEDSEARKAKEIKMADEARGGEMKGLTSSDTEDPEVAKRTLVFKHHRNLVRINLEKEFYERIREKYEKPTKKKRPRIRRLVIESSVVTSKSLNIFVCISLKVPVQDFILRNQARPQTYEVFSGSISYC